MYDGIEWQGIGHIANIKRALNLTVHFHSDYVNIYKSNVKRWNTVGCLDQYLIV